MKGGTGRPPEHRHRSQLRQPHLGAAVRPGFAESLPSFGEDEAPSHPELFTELADRLAADGFDVKHLVRAVCNSNAYQRTSRPVDGNRDDKALFSRMPVKVLAPAQLYDSLAGLFGEPAYKPRPVGGAPTPTARQAFLIFFEADGVLPGRSPGPAADELAGVPVGPGGAARPARPARPTWCATTCT